MKKSQWTENIGGSKFFTTETSNGMDFTTFLSHEIVPNDIDLRIPYVFYFDPEDQVYDLEMQLQVQYYKKLFKTNMPPSYCEDILDYHFEAYAGRKTDFLSFVSYTIRIIPSLHSSILFDELSIFDCSDLPEKRNVIIEWIERKETELEQATRNSKTEQSIKGSNDIRQDLPSIGPKQQYTTLIAAFTDAEKYQRMMDMLVNNNRCNNGNHHWTDTKEILIGTLKQFDIQGYLHRKLSQKEMITICKNTFGIIVSKRTCNTKPESVAIPVIPLASTL